MYDAFLSYSCADAAQAGCLDAWLTGQGLKVFFDRRELRAGRLWMPSFERAIEDESRAVLVLIGPRGLGNTQQYEAYFALQRQARNRGFPVVSIVLPRPADVALPSGFLSLSTWVDCSKAGDLRADPAGL